MLARVACALVLLFGTPMLDGCTAIRPLDPIDVDAARADTGLGGSDAGEDAAVPDDTGGLDAGHDAATPVDAFASDVGVDANCLPEVCGGGDEDCDGMIDEAGAIGSMAYYLDADSDGYGDDATLMMLCSPMVGGMRWVTRGGDCDDTNRLVRPGRAETCNALDDDCNGVIDDGTSCGFGCARLAYGGHTYQVCGDSRSEANAATQCMGWGYHLVDIGDMAENDAVAAEVSRLGLLGGACAGAWIGTMRTGGTMTYTQSDGVTPATYFDWDTATGEPNMTGPCVRMRASNGRWGDLLCSQSCGYVCEAP
jgi:hypothetical protein